MDLYKLWLSPGETSIFFFALMNEPPLYYTCAGIYDDDWLNDQYYIIRSC